MLHAASFTHDARPRPPFFAPTYRKEPTSAHPFGSPLEDEALHVLNPLSQSTHSINWFGANLSLVN